MTTDASKFIRPVVLPELQLCRAAKAQKVLPKLKEKFFLVPEVWAVKASKAGEQYRSRGALLIGLLIWREHRFNGDSRRVQLTKAKLRALRIGRYSARSGLAALEKAGLITVQRFKHRSPLITIV